MMETRPLILMQHVHEFVQFAIHNLSMNNIKYGATVTNIVL